MAEIVDASRFVARAEQGEDGQRYRNQLSASP
jgi:hypothetical protein